MKPITLQWVKKTEGDSAMVERERPKRYSKLGPSSKIMDRSVFYAFLVGAISAIVLLAASFTFGGFDTYFPESPKSPTVQFVRPTALWMACLATSILVLLGEAISFFAFVKYNHVTLIFLKVTGLLIFLWAGFDSRFILLNDSGAADQTPEDQITASADSLMKDIEAKGVLTDGDMKFIRENEDHPDRIRAYLDDRVEAIVDAALAWETGPIPPDQSERSLFRDASLVIGLATAVSIGLQVLARKGIRIRAQLHAYESTTVTDS